MAKLINDFYKPAFPCSRSNVEHEDGMSLRDWFAGQAMAALIIAKRDEAVIVEWAYDYADSMLVAREAP